MSDEEITKENLEAAKKRAAAKVEDLRFVLNNPASRRVITRILAKAGLFRISFERDNERVTALREGERSLGLWLFKELSEVNPEVAASLLVNVQNPHGLTKPPTDRLSA